MKNSRIAKLIGIGLLAIGMFGSVFGQVDSDNTKDQTLRGSGRVNASTLGMEFDLPVGSYSGRGINVPIGLSYSSKVWRIENTRSEPLSGLGPDTCIAINEARYAKDSASGWTNSMQEAYVEYSGLENPFTLNGEPRSFDCFLNGNASDPASFIRRIQVHLPSGESHELRMNDSPVTYPPTTGIQNGWYYAVDGSNLKYLEDSVNNTYILQYPDGSFYTFANVTVSLPYPDSRGVRKAISYKDRNGNQTTYHAADTSHPEYPNGYWIDTLGKAIGVPLSPTAPAVAGVKTYSMPGINGVPVTYQFHWKQLKGNTAAESGLTNFSDTLKFKGAQYATTLPGYGNPTWHNQPAGTSLFQSYPASFVYILSGATFNPVVFNPIVLTEIELPTGQKYKFGYNDYGIINRISYPTGGEEQFEVVKSRRTQKSL
jgi:hypothetical protein